MAKSSLLRFSVLLASLGATSFAATITFNTFVSSSAINAVEGQNNTIGFTYAGDKFVGSVYFGANNLQLYSTDLNGGNVQAFGAPLPTGGAEVVVAGSLGQGGFAAGTIYAGTGGNIYKYADSGGSPSLFASGLSGGVRGMLLDPGSSFGGNLLVSTTTGSIYSVTSGGVATLIASIGEDTEGMDIIPVGAPGWGALGGDLLVTSEGSGALRVITPGGTVIDTGLRLTALETVNFVPLGIGLSGNPLEGYYAANYPNDIQKASAAQFLLQGLGGHLLGTSELGGSSTVWDITYNGTSFASAAYTGTLSAQAEDGIFVTAQRINDTGSPEPGTMLLMGCGFVALGLALRRPARR
jgi:hypothetical protein